MKVLVTGGAGFIGSNLAGELVKRNFDVAVFDDFSTGSMDNLEAVKSKVKIMKGDIRNYGELKKAASNSDVVFHLAAVVGNVFSLEDPAKCMDVNATGTVNVISACRENNSSLIYSSSCAIFGETQHSPINENHPLNPVSPYGVSKLSGEQLCLSLGSYYNLNVACLRYFNVYGRNQRFNPYGNVLPIFAERLKNGKPLVVYGDGRQTRDFVDVRDIVAANILAFEKQAKGVFNIATGTASTVNGLVEFLGEASGKKLQVVNERPRPGEVRDSVADISKARKYLGFSPKIPLKQGVKDYLEWFNS